MEQEHQLTTLGTAPSKVEVCGGSVAGSSLLSNALARPQIPVHASVRSLTHSHNPALAARPQLWSDSLCRLKS